MNPSVSFALLILIPAILLIHLTTASAQADNYHQLPPETVAKGIPSSSTQNIPADQTPQENLPNYLSFNYYRNTCPDLEAIVHRKVKEWMHRDYSLAPSLLRLHFHDCSVRGCDASILLNGEGSERTADASKTLRGFEVVDDIKSEVEKKCPKTVSCADILTSAARDATVSVGGPYWRVPYGRKDGRVSIAKEAERVPMGRETITHLIQFYQSKGLDVLDLAVLSGAHTIGRATCGSIQYRLYNFNQTGKPDPSINHKYLNYLRRKCRWASEYVDLDASTPAAFDAAYYTNLQLKMGLLRTDQMLHTDSRTSPLITALASQPHIFHHQFAASMVKLGNIQVLTGEHEGEVRVNCNHINPY
ncbi:peroxidase 7-like [Malania oleifera]|uniref:peroxidase 7-like n=1 Tax=Malania oleifera TaxID=397392 RepID=UPI0025ADF3F0|nr:peroxidase 7-like [Malania oleifera]